MLATNVTRDADTGVTDVWLAGALDLVAASRVRAVVRKCIADDPHAIVIDVNALDVVSDIALTVFPALYRQQSSHDTPVPLLVHARAGSPGASAFGGALARFVPVHADRAAALRSLGARPGGTLRDHLQLAPVSGSPASARAFAVGFCHRGGVPHLADSAQVVVSELVTNAVRHAGTVIGVSMARGRDHLTISVRDGSSRPPSLTIDHARRHPLASGARGLLLVDRLSAGWGTFAHTGGKTIWATLLVRRHSSYLSHTGA
jgi:hypothetical protein